VCTVDVVQRRPLARVQANPLEVGGEIEHPGSLTAGVRHDCASAGAIAPIPLRA
jgi:hypothetical protein